MKGLLSVLLVAAISLILVAMPAAVQDSAHFVLGTSSSALPILLDPSGEGYESIRIAAEHFAEDVERLVGSRPSVQDAREGTGLGKGRAILVCTAESSLAVMLQKSGGQGQTRHRGDGQAVFQREASSEVEEMVKAVRGRWESFEGRVIEHPLEGIDEALVLIGSDRRGAIYALYTLSEHFGVSPFHWWADVPIPRKDVVSLEPRFKISHGEPTVKYRGFFLNDEHPVLWNWARQRFAIQDGPPFQTGLYEKVFELLLRLKGNYLWPAMWHSAFAVDGLDTLPLPPAAGPNQLLAERYGVVMGTSHHEPMSRNQKEFHDHGHGDWDFDTNGEFLKEFWEYGAERAKDCETLFTVGMRGDGDLPLPGADIERLEKIVSVQQSILKSTLDKTSLSDTPQTWAMYKEVMSYFASGLKVPEEVTPLLSDDNWGNLMAVMPSEEGQEPHKAGGGVYYHADYVGDPRNYKWLNTVSLPKMWEQLNLARSLNTKNIWILNVGDLKMLELPLEWFMSLGYDFDSATQLGLFGHLSRWAQRDFQLDDQIAGEVADIMLKYTMYASRRKAELVDTDTFSLIDYDEADRLVGQWADLENRSEAIFTTLKDEVKLPFEQLVRTPVRLQANLNRIYISAAKSNLYASQGRTAANVCAQDAIDRFRNDQKLTDEFHALNGSKWNYTLCQSHIGYQYWQSPVRNTLPPISFVQNTPSYINVIGPIHTRFTVENSKGAWPGDNKHNCPLGYNCPDPVLLPVDPYSRKRWVEVGSGGTMDIQFTAEPEEDWVVVEPREGQVKGDGTADVRVWLSVDWTRFPKEAGEKADGHVKFTSTDGSKMVVTLPAMRGKSPPPGFRGAVQGDGYVAIEAAHYTSSTAATRPQGEHKLEEVPYYGKTLSGMTILPPTLHHWEKGEAGPSLSYDFFVTDYDSKAVEVILDFGPSLNYILGERLEIQVKMDDHEEWESVKPVPESKPGTVPDDWEQVVANEIREVKIPMEMGGEIVGKHRLTIRGVRGGLVLERVMIDLGGIKARGQSYLGPPESHMIS